MSTNRVILCNGVCDARIKGRDKSPIVLSSQGASSNVNLEIEDIKEAMWQEVPRRINDLIDIAAFVYVADQATSRGSIADSTFGNAWNRRLFFRIPVRDLEFWRQRQVKECLTQTLGFLSDDSYEFDFVPVVENGPTFQKRLDFGADAQSRGIEEVVLYSGGLDSLAGAVQESVIDKRRVMLVNHRSHEKHSKQLSKLLGSLRKHAGEHAPEQTRVRINKEEELTVDYTQRSRSFLYASLGMAIANMLGLKRIRFYENGVLSINLPLSGQAVGGRSTRTTHPRVLDGFRELFSHIADDAFEVENPFQWKTKTEVVEILRDAGCGDLIGKSISCAHPRQSDSAHPHCGVCSQCIDRRVAVVAAKEEEHDPASRYSVDLFTGARVGERDRLTLAGYFEIGRKLARIDQTEFFGSYGELFQVLPYLGGANEATASRLYDLFARHGKSVESVIHTAIVRHHKELADRTLPDSCLVRMTADTTGSAAARPSQPNEGGDNYFIRRGEAWKCRFAGGMENILLDRKGAQYLHYVLSRPNRRLDVAEVATLGDVHPELVSVKSTQPVVDKELLRNCQERWAQLSLESEDARVCNDPGRQEAAQREMDQITDNLRSSMGKRQSVRAMGDARNRMRISVQKELARTLEKIRRFDLPFWKHLDAALSTGWDVTYEPKEPVDWTTS